MRQPLSAKIEDLFIRANREWERGHLRSAFRLFSIGARAGDPGAQTNLGHFYDTGKGVRPNRRQALYWYGRAFKGGYSAGAASIAIIHRDAGQTKKALMWFRRAVRLGDGDANLEIAKLYLREKKGTARAIPYLRRTIKSVSGTEVTEDSRQEAKRLVKQLGKR